MVLGFRGAPEWRITTRAGRQLIAHATARLWTMVPFVRAFRLIRPAA
jgi:hypothetical protein